MPKLVFIYFGFVIVNMKSLYLKGMMIKKNSGDLILIYGRTKTIGDHPKKTIGILVNQFSQ